MMDQDRRGTESRREERRRYRRRAWKWGFGAILPVSLVIALLFAFARDRSGLGDIAGAFLISLVYALCAGPLMYLAIPFFFPRFHRLPFPVNWLLNLAAVLILTGLGCLLANLVLVGVGLFPREFFWVNYVRSLGIGAVIGVSMFVGIYFYEKLRYRLDQTTLQLRTRQLETEQALRAATEARLASLESRLRPHFLFNTLNSVSALTREDPERAEQMVGRLAALLRYSLDAGMQGLVPLREEIKIVRDYLDIERERFGDRLRYSLDAAGELEGAEVPPLALQTLVENSVKHAVSNDPSGGEIRVRAAREGESILLEVWDDGPGFEPRDIAPGHGLDNLRARMSVLFGASAALEILERDGGTAVMVRMPCRVGTAVGS